MTITFTTCPFEVIAGDNAGIVIDPGDSRTNRRASLCG
jgi:hypothetical protein